MDRLEVAATWILTKKRHSLRLVGMMALESHRPYLRRESFISIQSEEQQK
jgi:hypothetical protein